ncbi:[FeFe] hydrogenase H-cluster radical SAM maturase HydE [Mycoplasmatota bacterium]|nr:[FeFe] hydrogenase H-cluster radical SAM maturase HydE [Mycoplasmatota bacterium]
MIGDEVIVIILSNLEIKNPSKESEKVKNLLYFLKKNKTLSKEEFLFVLDNITQEEFKLLRELAYSVREENFGNSVYMRALIEISNYCSQGCKYCGIRRNNKLVDRYRLDKDSILNCANEGYLLGYRTFVLQAGEDKYYNDELLCDIVSSIKKNHPDTAITLSIGERTKESYQKLFDAGANRYLLRHESASRRLYDYIHPDSSSYDNRIKSLYNLKDIGYQVGAGFMVGLPTQTNEDLVEDLLFLQKLKPEMCGIGPYLCHSETPLKGNVSGTLNQTLVMVALTRLILPNCLLPSTTALGTLSNTGREEALKAGANVVMPNLSPVEHRVKYEIYQHKICTGDEAAHCRNCIENRINFTGFVVDMGIGHHKNFGG